MPERCGKTRKAAKGPERRKRPGKMQKYSKKKSPGRRGGGWGAGTYYVSVSMDVPPKGVQFSESVWDGVYSILQILGRGSNIPV